MKTHKGLAKRVKVTANGKIKIHKAGASHLMSVKNAKRRRRIRKTGHRGQQGVHEEDEQKRCVVERS